MGIDWSGKEKEILDKLGSVKFKLDNPEEFKRKVLSQIFEKEKPDDRFIGWTRIAAGVLIFILVSTYVVEEGFTHYSRYRMEASLSKTDIIPDRSENCRDVIQYYLSVNSRFNFLEQTKDTVLLSLVDVAFLKEYYPDYGLRIDEFIKAMKRFYPLDYSKFRSGAVIKLNLNMLRNDTRLCELLANNKW